MKLGVAAIALVLAASAHAADTRGTLKLMYQDTSGKAIGSYSGSYALLIGVSKYTAGWPALEAVPGELDQVEAALKRQGFLTRKVLDPDSKTLQNAFDAFIEDYGYDRDNRLLFFFSGHGATLDSGEKGYLVPVDAPNPARDEKNFRRRALDMTDVLAWCKKMTAKHAIFLFDSCFSGTIFKSKSMPEVPPHITVLTDKPVRQFISAGTAGQEVPARSVFALSLIKALRGEADLNRDRFVTGTELGMYLHEKVTDYSDGLQTPQYGKIRDPALDEGDTVFGIGTPAGAGTGGGVSAAAGETAWTRLEKKMESIRIPEMDFRHANIQDVVLFLSRISIEFDNTSREDEVKGVNIIVNLNVHSPLGPAGAVVEVPPITFREYNISLLDALKRTEAAANMKHRMVGNVVMLVPATSQESEGAGGATPAVVGESVRPRVEKKMESIRIPEVDFRQANIQDVVTFLRESSVELDNASKEGEAKGVNIILDLGVPPTTGAAGAVIEVPPMTFQVRSVSLLDVLKIVMEITGLRYRIVGDAVVIVPNTPQSGKIRDPALDKRDAIFGIGPQQAVPVHESSAGGLAEIQQRAAAVQKELTDAVGARRAELLDELRILKARQDKLSAKPAPAQSPAAAAPVAWPALVITGVAGKGDRGAVTIDGEMVGVGEVVKGVRVKNILARGVELEFGGETRTVGVGQSIGSGGPAAAQQEPLKAGQPVAIDLGGGVRLELVWCPPGEFLMGSPETEVGRQKDEAQHPVRLTRGFWMGKYEVTQEQWERVMGNNPSSFTGPRNPVDRVSWNDCQEFVRKLNGMVEGGGFRLPTEAEWEYACRAGSRTGLYTGKELTATSGRCPNVDEIAWYGENSGGTSHAVGQKKPNAWGLFDMAGNLWEWCQDYWYGYYPTGLQIDPSGPSSGEQRVFRGGYWEYIAICCRSATRGGNVPDGRWSSVGFRVARSQP